MTSAKSIGRTVGILSLLRLPLAPLVNFALFPPATAREFLVTAPGAAPTVRLGLMLTLLNAALGLAIVIVVFPLFRRHSERLAYALLLLTVVGIGFVVAENFAVVQMLSLADAHHGVPGPDVQVQALGRAARATWLWSHFSNILVGVVGLSFFSWILYRHAFVPRLLAALALVTSVFAAGAVAMHLIGYPFALWTLTPMGVVQLVLLVWLLARGFSEHPLPERVV